MDHSNYNQYPPGVYKFKITGSIGSDPLTVIQSDFVFEIYLVDLCSQAMLSFNAAAAPS